MDVKHVAEYARALYEAHGETAEAEAARRARDCEEAGQTQEAETWRSVRRAITEMRGAHES
jgi:hypothetical protein